MVSKAREDLPDPESPVNTMSASRGSSRCTSFTLCSLAPRMTRWLAADSALVGGGGAMGPIVPQVRPRLRGRIAERELSGRVPPGGLAVPMPRGWEDGGMHPTVLALLEVVLLAGGGLAARRFVRRVGRGDRKLVLMASVAAWLVLFGMVPFWVFAAFVGPGTERSAGPVETLVLNLVPLALVASPALGIAQARALTGR